MTDIPFADKGWAIATGCAPKGAGCLNCFAARLAGTRLKHHPDYKGLAEYRDGRGHWIAPPRFNAHRLTDPLRWRKPRRVFVAHTGDLFHKDISSDQIMDVWDTMSMCPQHTFMVFTKRWARAQSLLLKHAWQIRYSAVNGILPNVHLVFSASTQAEVDECAPILRDTPAAKRGLSLEPLLDCIQLHLWHNTWLDFLIAGGETSLRKSLARPCPNGAPQGLQRQCAHFDIPFWFKGWGAHVPAGQVKGLLDGVRYEEMV